MGRSIVIAVIVFSLLVPVFTISCDGTQEPEPEAWAVIGPEGGVVNVTDPESPLAGARIDIPEGAVTEDTTFTISAVADPPQLPNPEDIAEASPTVNIEADNELSGFIAVTIPCPTVTNVTQIMKAYHYDEGTSEWEEVPSVFSNAEAGTITIMTDHLSWYRAVIEAIYINPASFALSDFCLGSDRTTFKNDYYYTSPDPDACTEGMCHGMSSLVKYWYENKDTDLQCAYSPEAGAPVTCNLQRMHENIWSRPLLIAEYSTTGIFDATAVWQWCLTLLNTGHVPLIAISDGLVFSNRHCVAGYKWEHSTAGDILGYLYIYDPDEPTNANLRITCRATTLLGIPIVKMEYSNDGHDYKYFVNSFIYKSQSVVEDLISDFPPDNWCQSTPVTFPDTNLDAVVREAIGNPPGDIYISDLKELTSLDARERNITDLSGLECAISLTYLDLAHNQVNDVSPLYDLTCLIDLNLDHNQIPGIAPLANLTNLTSLDLGSNPISDISPLADLTGLTHLDLGGNQITDIAPLADLTGLTSLELRDNNISDISPLASLTNLTSLSPRENQISDISALANLTNLTYLALSENQIVDISPLANLTNLTDLTLRNNQISDISPLAGLTSLTYLLLSSNQIIDISPLANLTNLTDLTLSENQISDILPLAGLTSLTYLLLRDNEIIDISPLVNLTNLTDLTLSSNQIIDVSTLANLANLRYLTLSENQISNISSLTNLINLTYLRLRWNQISDISALVDNSGLAEGDEVYLDHNPLSSDSINIYIPALQARGVTVYY